ncbi:MAG TPA: ABC transporter permease [Candidatus Binataceae bacterium]|jgi:ABC-2 type transport system permease protein|nr:ABC transporter permease [Candidatus Binataceae bacterium]
MKKTWAVMRRDLLKLSRNPLTILTAIMLPIIYLVIFGNSFQGVLKHLPIVVVSQDNGPFAVRVMEQVQALAAGPKTITVTYAADPATAIAEVRNGRFKAALIIPPRFSREITAGRIGELGLFMDNVDSISAATLEGLIAQAVAVLRVGFVTAREPKLDQIFLRPSNLFATVDYDRSLIPGVIVMALFMGSLTSGVFNWVMDRFLGVTESYLVTPLSRWNLAGGVLASSVLVTSLAAIIVLVIGLLITGGGITGGPLAMLMLVGVIIVGATGILAMTFALMARATNPRIVGVSAGFLNVILFFPSGAVYPVESFPPWLRAFARYNPETHAVAALKSILFKGANFAAVSSDLAFLLIFTALMLTLASRTVKRTL